MHVFALLILVGSLGAAENADPFSFFEQEHHVITAARQSQPLRQSPVAVEVITRRDIQNSPAADFWDLLRFRAGLDVIDGRSTTGANRAVVSVRGFNRDLVTELQVLVDGRSVYGPVSGGVLWQQIPVQLQDIERIEIVRGPNAALYGANAGLGVINIITRRPARRLSLEGGGTVGTQKTRIGEGAVETAGRSGGLRLSHTWRNNEGYPSALAGGVENDFLQSNKANARGWWQPSAGTVLEGFAGGAWDNFGKPALADDPRAMTYSHFQMGRLRQSLWEGSSLELTLSRNDATQSQDVGTADYQDTRYYQYDSEAVHHFEWGRGALQTTWGGAWRYVGAQSREILGDHRTHVNRSWRLFYHQRARVHEQVSLVGGVSYEDPDVGTRHKDWQAAVVYTPTAEHALRAGYALAHTDPYIVHTDINYRQPPVYSVVGNPTVESYPLRNAEVGYRGELAGRSLVLESAFFYTTIRDHVDTERVNGPAFLNYTYLNQNMIIARGVEATVRFRGPGWTGYVNYTYEHITDAIGHRLFTETTPPHKLNVGGYLDLGRGLTASIDAGWKDGYLADSIAAGAVPGMDKRHVNAFWRLDAKLGWRPLPDVELFVKGRNLLVPRRREYVDGLLVPRIILGGVSVRWRP